MLNLNGTSHNQDNAKVGWNVVPAILRQNETVGIISPSNNVLQSAIKTMFSTLS